jgi:hypothetical protein
MEIKELPDYVVYYIPSKVFMVWGQIRQKENGEIEWGWCGTKEDAHASTFTFTEACHHVESMKKIYAGTYEVRSREKTKVTLTKA